ncbi:anion permease [Thermosipho ferrireducens]|uniref:Anion permease n=1 Tax=Thermosipho ferrireducens TaxID=2571116 RepID=A0ABX7S5P5_9BACT|nr:inorganic phosphate transporter [Thermosipho ferrireducens]QTA37879.1 anion permease [Thermosipho ferrireducens]
MINIIYYVKITLNYLSIKVIMMLWILLPSVLFGIVLGANDVANVFGPLTANGVLKYKKAIIFSSISVILGALLQGKAGTATIGTLAPLNDLTGSISLLTATIVVTFVNFLKIPVSTTQAIVGSIIGSAVFSSISLNIGKLQIIIISWILTPALSFIFGILFSKIFSLIFSHIKHIVTQNFLIKILSWIFLLYGAYSLGANNLGNIVGVLNKKFDFSILALIGGISISIGTIFFSKRATYNIGKKLIALTEFTAFLVVISATMTVWIYAMIGIPVSFSQSILGAMLGVSFANGMKAINKKVISKLVFTWVGTPTISFIISFFMNFLIN